MESNKDKTAGRDTAEAAELIKFAQRRAKVVI
jgi:hypothetical protein